ncbi:MAG: LUD domain-containing protein [Motiliproteus sp.]
MTDSSSRQQIMANLHRGLNRDTDNSRAKSAVLERISQRPRSTIPARSQLDHSGQVELFKAMALEAVAELLPLDSIDQLPAAVDEFMQQNQQQQLIMASSAQLTALDWSQATHTQIKQRVVLAGDVVSLTSSFAGIAETGTLMLHSGSDSPTTLNFLSDIHLVVLQTSTIVGCYEDGWQALRQQQSDGSWPRTVNMITGPSRSADIEQKLQMGAHGPKRLVIFLVDDG